MSTFVFILNLLAFCLSATDFCSEPLGMKRSIILDQQITESSVYLNRQVRKGFNARLDGLNCWCSFTGSTLDQQWVKVDLRYPMSIRGISIQGDPAHLPNYIEKFTLRYSVDGTNFLYKTTDTNHHTEELIGATGQSQTIHRMFVTKPFAARYIEFRPTQIPSGADDACVRFELYGCSYVCNEGLGIEHGTALPSGFIMTSSSNQNGKDASSARLDDASSSWCASSNNVNQYLQIDFGRTLTITGIAVQGNPIADSWVKNFYFDYGMDLNSLVTYQETGTRKLFVGNVDRDTKVVNWFKVRLFTRYIKIKPNSWNGDICMRMEIIGCHAESVYELGAENRALENSRFTASGHTEWTTGRYDAFDGRLNNDKPWGVSKSSATNPWFKVDLGRVMLVNGISIQGDGGYGPNYYPDYKIQYSFDPNVAVGALIGIKEETTTAEKVFTGNTNNAGVKFNLIANPISTRHVRFMKSSTLLNDYTLRVEIYGQPQVCTTSFGMEAGSKSTYNPTVVVSSGSIPADKAKINSPTAWCATTTDTNQYFEYDFGGIRTISGFAIQGHPVDLKWATTFNVDYKEQQSQFYTTYQEGGSSKAFVGSSTQNLIVYHWFATNLRMRYLRIKPLTWNTEICLRLNVYGCPSADCFSEVGISTNTIADAMISSSTQVSTNEAHKGRLNMESVWEACQFGSCTPKESSVNKPWIQVCLSSVQRFTSIIVQGPGDFDNIAKVTAFSLKFDSGSSGSFQSYNIDGSLKKFSVSGGRYTSSQIDLPFAIVSKCIRLQVESQSPTNQNAGLRWELLGCTTIPQVSSVTITPANPSIAKGGDVTLSCNANALPGAQITWKKGTVALATIGVYEVGTVAFSNDNNNYKLAMTLKITATASYITSSFQSCSVTDSSQGSTECKQSYECSASYGGISSSLKSTTTEVTVTGLQAKPSKPFGISNSSLTNSSFSLNWNAATPADFPIKDYKIVLKKKADSSLVKTNSNVASTTTTFNGLESFTEYIVEISAQSSLGAFSDVATLEVKTDEGVSVPPASISATTISTSHILLIWSQPASFNGILYDYKIRYKATADSTYGSSSSAGVELNYTISGLRPFTEYNMQVRASTKGGTILGQWTSAANSTTFEGLPSEPQNLATVEAAARSVKIKWKKPQTENGIVRNYTIQFSGSKGYNSSFSQQDSEIVQQNSSSESTNSILIGLVPGTDYSIEIAATTGGGTGNFSTALKVKTLFAAPPKPLLQDQGITNGVRTFYLGGTSDINGPISEYQISIAVGQMTQCSEKDPKDVIDPTKFPMTLQVTQAVKNITGISLKMETIGNYTLCYKAVIKDQGQNFVSESVLVTFERKHLEKLDPGIFSSEITGSSVVVPLVQGPTGTKNYHIIVIEGSTSTKSPDEWLPSELGPYDASTYTVGKPYIAAVLSSYVSNFTVGDGSEYSSSTRKRRNIGTTTYRNVPLKANTQYLVFQRSYVSQNTYFSSPWMGPLKTKESNGGSSSPTKNSDIPLILGIVGAVLILAIITFVFVIFSRRRKAKTEDNASVTKKPVMMVPLSQSSDNPSFNDDEDEATNVEDTLPAAKSGSTLERRRSSASSLRRKKAPRSIKHDSHHPPISIEDFARQCKELHRDSHHGITLEYEDLGKGQQYSWDIAVNSTNKPKNRYANIAAYDHSRVKLNPIPGIPYSDYFNANFISGYLRDSVYIASQGPIDSVLGDFWRMIWDKNVPAIVMLTNLMEGAKKKCSQYWPDMGSAEFGKVTVTSVSVESYVDYTIRCFSVSRTGFNENRTVYQFHYTTWPDHSIPESPTDLLNLQRKLRKTFPFSIESPIVVHCSAGVGRTGTFIVIDAMLELLQSQRKIDVFNYLNFIRTQRIQMVQVEEQYLFIYKALLESVTCGMTEIETQNLRIKINQLSAKEKSKQTGFDKQFQRLVSVTPHFNEKETTTGLLKNNLSRNRKSNIVPREKHRVILQQSIYENDGSTDYINAIYVSGYKRKNAYIATQHPLPNTINDFWSMIYQSNVATFVLLNKIQTKPENLPVFWPESGKETIYGNTVVRNELEQDAFDSTERNFVISHRDSRGNEREVKMLHFQNWPDHAVPKECDKLLMLISKVEKCQQQQSEDQPIVIICSDGASRSGTFIAITIILERFKTEQLVDVFQTINKLRAFRPEFVENALQYKFCHTIVQDYMASFDDYSNFTG